MNSISPNLNIMIKASQKASKALIRDFGEIEKLQVSVKGPSNFVSNADTKAEKIIIEELTKAKKNYSIISEEDGTKINSDSENVWIIDPIDGTRSFVNHIPLFGTILALEDTIEKEVLIGVIHLPVLQRTYAAARGLGAHLNGVGLCVAPQKPIKEAIIAAGDIAQFISVNRTDTYQKLSEHCPYLRTYTDCFGHALVVSGAISAMLDPALNPWDFLASKVLVEEAGGSMLICPSTITNKVDILFGSSETVKELAKLVDFG